RLITAGYLVTSMLSLGLEVGAAPKEDKAHKRAQRRLLVRALLINLVLLPLVAIGVIHLLHATGDVALALVLLAVTPGGRIAPQLVRIAGAEVALSVEITLFLAKLTAFTAPPLMKLLLGVSHLELHDLVLIAQLVLLQIAPYALGKLMRRRWSLAERLVAPVRLLELASVVSIVGFLVLNRQIRSVLLINGSGWLALFAVAAISLALGWLLGGSPRDARRAIALGVNARNLPLALVVAGLAYPTRGVESVVFAVWLVLFVVSLALALGWRRYGEPVGTRAALSPSHWRYPWTRHSQDLS
ncbi:MAG: bile acid:sodium symporter family protein, partial [Polyangia bacterium]